MKDKDLRRFLFGIYHSQQGKIGDAKFISFNTGGQKKLEIRADDGLILTLLERIVRLEEKIKVK